MTMEPITPFSHPWRASALPSRTSSLSFEQLCSRVGSHSFVEGPSRFATTLEVGSAFATPLSSVQHLEDWVDDVTQLPADPRGPAPHHLSTHLPDARACASPGDSGNHNAVHHHPSLLSQSHRTITAPSFPSVGSRLPSISTHSSQRTGSNTALGLGPGRLSRGSQTPGQDHGCARSASGQGLATLVDSSAGFLMRPVAAAQALQAFLVDEPAQDLEAQDLEAAPATTRLGEAQSCICGRITAQASSCASRLPAQHQAACVGGIGAPALALAISGPEPGWGTANESGVGVAQAERPTVDTAAGVFSAHRCTHSVCHSAPVSADVPGTIGSLPPPPPPLPPSRVASSAKHGAGVRGGGGAFGRPLASSMLTRLRKAASDVVAQIRSLSSGRSSRGSSRAGSAAAASPAPAPLRPSTECTGVRGVSSGPDPYAGGGTGAYGRRAPLLRTSSSQAHSAYPPPPPRPPPASLDASCVTAPAILVDASSPMRPFCTDWRSASHADSARAQPAAGCGCGGRESNSSRFHGFDSGRRLGSCATGGSSCGFLDDCDGVDLLPDMWDLAQVWDELDEELPPASAFAAATDEARRGRAYYNTAPVELLDPESEPEGEPSFRLSQREASGRRPPRAPLPQGAPGMARATTATGLVSTCALPWNAGSLEAPSNADRLTRSAGRASWEHGGYDEEHEYILSELRQAARRTKQAAQRARLSSPKAHVLIGGRGAGTTRGSDAQRPDEQQGEQLQQQRLSAAPPPGGGAGGGTSAHRAPFAGSAATGVLWSEDGHSSSAPPRLSSAAAVAAAGGTSACGSVLLGSSLCSPLDSALPSSLGNLVGSSSAAKTTKRQQSQGCSDVEFEDLDPTCRKVGDAAVGSGAATVSNSLFDATAVAAAAAAAASAAHVTGGAAHATGSVAVFRTGSSALPSGGSGVGWRAGSNVLHSGGSGLGWRPGSSVLTSGASGVGLSEFGPELSMIWPLVMSTPLPAAATAVDSDGTSGGAGTAAAAVTAPCPFTLNALVNCGCGAVVECTGGGDSSADSAGAQLPLPVSVTAVLSGVQLAKVPLQPGGGCEAAALTLPLLPAMQLLNVFASRGAAVGPAANLLAVPPAMATELHALFAERVARSLERLTALTADGGSAAAAASGAPTSLRARVAADLTALRAPSAERPPWSMSVPVWAACRAEWRSWAQPLLADMCYLLLCVPNCFAHGLVEWDRAMYCETLARLLAQLEAHKMWQTLAALLEHCSRAGVALLYQGRAVGGAALTPDRLRSLLEGALHDEISIKAVGGAGEGGGVGGSVGGAWSVGAMDGGGSGGGSGSGGGRARRRATLASLLPPDAADAATARTLTAWRRSSVDGPSLLSEPASPAVARAGMPAAAAAAAPAGLGLRSQASISRVLTRVMARLGRAEERPADGAAVAPAAGGPVAAAEGPRLGQVIENAAVVLAFAGVMLQTLL